MSYEYKFVIKVNALEDISNMGAQRFAFGLATDMQVVADALTTPPVDEIGWEPVSHDTTQIGPFLVTTVLMRRPKQ